MKLDVIFEMKAFRISIIQNSPNWSFLGHGLFTSHELTEQMISLPQAEFCTENKNKVNEIEFSPPWKRLKLRTESVKLPLIFPNIRQRILLKAILKTQGALIRMPRGADRPPVIGIWNRH
jgi:hypothetical protein